MSPHCAAHTRLYAGAPIHVSHHILHITTSVLSALFKEESSKPDALRGVWKLKGISQDFKSLQNKCRVLRFYTLYILCCLYHSQLPRLPGRNSQHSRIYKIEHIGKINFKKNFFLSFWSCEDQWFRRQKCTCMFLNYHILRVVVPEVLIKSQTLLSVSKWFQLSHPMLDHVALW